MRDGGPQTADGSVDGVGGQTVNE